MQHGNRAVELLTQLQLEFTQSGIVPLLDDMNEIYWLDASCLLNCQQRLENWHFFMLFNLLLLFLIVFHYFDTLGLHQTSFLNVKFFLSLGKTQEYDTWKTTKSPFRKDALNPKNGTTTETFASISSTFSLASCSMNAIICLICYKKKRDKYRLWILFFWICISWATAQWKTHTHTLSTLGFDYKIHQLEVANYSLHKLTLHCKQWSFMLDIVSLLLCLSSLTLFCLA